MTLQSPWLYQLKRTRPVDRIVDDVKTDVAVIGAGVSGVMTAYFLLKNTDKQVTLIEGGQVAHGATGHNAGQLVAEFERSFTSLVEEYGIEKSVQAEEAVKSAWILLEEIYRDARLETPMSSFIGYAGYASMDKVIEELKNNALRVEGGMMPYQMYVAKESDHQKIPIQYKELYTIIPKEDILSLLETHDGEYIAAQAGRRGCVNGALLIEEIVGYMLSAFRGRFTIFEHTHVKDIVLEKDHVTLKHEEYTITTGKVVLCTNGFERFSIKNNVGKEIDKEFHHRVKGSVGYMAGYLEELKHPPTALAYFDRNQIGKGHAQDTYHEPPYFYLTRRPYELEQNQKHNLICLGGPEVLIADTKTYSHEGEYADAIKENIHDFLKKTFIHSKDKDIQYKFFWHGLLGYTSNGIRLIGEEPKNKNLLYNLGCNGIGILPSIYGGERISHIIAGKKLEPSIFDPKSIE